MSEAVSQVIAALNVLYTDPNPTAKEKANGWLQSFQKETEAWSTAQMILFAPDAPIEPKLFAAQTFRTKISYDLDQLPPVQLVPLRDSLLTALRTFAVSGPRVILTQICIALADLALQATPEQWNDPTSFMIEMFGKDAQMAGALLEFLQVLAEEYNSNMKLQVKNDFGRTGGKNVQRSDQVISLLSMYIQATGITPSLQNQVFTCLGSWLRTGQAAASSIAGQPLLESIFSALSSDELFDAAVDVLVDLIHETQELHENVEIIQQIVPKLTQLRSVVALQEVQEDEDRLRGYCRVLVEAGEWYEPLIVQHQESFLPLVQAIAACANSDNLEIVGITVNFWYRLSRGLRKYRDTHPASPELLAVFSNLVETIITHLHYPQDEESLRGQERDTFRSFRHTIGDTLKDCCTVLGATTCLRRSYEIIAGKLAAGSAVRWQEIEAPLFSMRSMGAEVDPNENDVMPQIMQLLPNLPDHPKIRYASILVIGRYTQWLDYHPQLIETQLPYITAAFQDGNSDVIAAAAQTMKYFCKDCSQKLIDFLPQLKIFLDQIQTKIQPEDFYELSTAIGHIIASMPQPQQPAALATFVMPNVEIVHTINQQHSAVSKKDLRLIADALERIDTLLAIVDRIPLPDTCLATLQQVWSVVQIMLNKFGRDPLIADKASLIIRRGLYFFEHAGAFQLAPSVLPQLAESFQRCPHSGFLWVTAKFVCAFSHQRDAQFDSIVGATFQSETEKLFQLSQQTSADQISDLLGDYLPLLLDLIEFSPATVFLSDCFPASYSLAVTSLGVLNPSIALCALDALRAIIGHESLQPDSHAAADPNANLFAQRIRGVVETSCSQLVAALIVNLIEAHEDLSSNILTVFRLLSIMFTQPLSAAVPAAVSQLNAKTVAEAEKAEFLGKFQNAISISNPNQVKESFTWLLRTSRRRREREIFSSERS